MDGWIVLGDLYIRPVDWEEMFVLKMTADCTAYECSRHRTDGTVELIGRGVTPRMAAKLVAV